MKIVVTVMFFAVVTTTPTPRDLLQEEWKEFKLTHNKNYQSKEEEAYRMKIFAESKARVAKFNQAYLHGEQIFKTGINQFSDMTLEEFNNKMNGYRPKPRKSQKINAKFMPRVNIKLPREMDWRKIGAVTQVKDQQLCASCWSFSATGALESQFFLKNNKSIFLSEQNLIDCSGKDTIYKNNGCNGGDVESSFRYVYYNGGIDNEMSYPYEASENICRYNKTNSGVKDKGYSIIKEGDEKELKMKVAVRGPASVGIYANTTSFKDYASGIYYHNNCLNDTQYLNHAMLVVGYGTDKYSRMDYWIVKNSYGTTWGEKGYIRMARNRNNQCGIATRAVVPIL